MGLLDDQFYSDPGRMGMMRFGLGLLSNGGVNNSGIARAMGGMMDGELEDRRRKADDERRQQEAMLMQLKMRAAQGDYEAAEQARQMQAAISADLKNDPTNSSAAQPSQPAQNMPQLGSAPQQSRPGMPQLGAPAMPTQGAQGPNSGYSRQSEIARYSREADIRAKHGDHAGASALRDKISKITPQVKNWQEVEVGGRVLYAPFYEDGTAGEPVPLEIARKLEIKNTGGYTDAIDPYTGATKTRIKNTQSPESIANNAVTMRGQNMVDARGRDLNEITRQGNQTQIINDPMRGPMLVDKGTGQVRQAMINGQAIQGEVPAKREASARAVLPILAQAEALIDKSTGSYAGAGIDQVARVFGGSTGGAEANARLKALEGNLMMAQPRMEGPQSNMDVLLYRQMAGQIGDPTVTPGVKKAALAEIRRLTEQYAGGAKPPAGPAQGGTPPDIADLLNKYK